MGSKKFYMVSEDILNLISGAGVPGNYYAQQGCKVPARGLFEELRKDMEENLKDLFGNVRMFSEREMGESLNAFVEEARYPVVSLDRIYIGRTPKVKAFLDPTRVNDNGEIKLMMRSGVGSYRDIDREISIVSNKIKTITGKKRPSIAVVDDVIFSGDGVWDIASRFAGNGVVVREAFGGICTDGAKAFLSNKGIEVVYGCKIENFIDQICERDFYLGLPQSGMFVNEGDRFSKRPYFSPFGDPVGRASIPENQSLGFSARCIERSAALWKEVEKKSKKVIRVENLPEPVYGLRDNKARLLDVLGDSKKALYEGGYSYDK